MSRMTMPFGPPCFAEAPEPASVLTQRTAQLPGLLMQEGPVYSTCVEKGPAPSSVIPELVTSQTTVDRKCVAPNLTVKKTASPILDFRPAKGLAEQATVPVNPEASTRGWPLAAANWFAASSLWHASVEQAGRVIPPTVPEPQKAAACTAPLTNIGAR